MLLKKCTAIFVAGLMLANCASAPEPLPQLTEDVRSSLGTTGIITIGPTVGGNLEGPIGVGNQVAIGVLSGGAIGAAGGAGAGALIGLTCGPLAFLCVPAGAIGGGVAGLVAGGTTGGIIRGRDAIPGDTAEEIQMAVARAIADHELQADLRHRVLQRMDSATKGIDLGAGGTVPEESPDYISLSDQGINTVLEMSLTQLGFVGEGGDDPPLDLIITARARLIEVPGNSILWQVEQVTYHSQTAAFSLWTEGESDLLQAEIDNGMEAVAGQIGEALFASEAI